MDLANPQTRNRYAYVVNNPLALTDPSGLCSHAGIVDDVEDCYSSGTYGFNGLDVGFDGGAWVWDDWRADLWNSWSLITYPPNGGGAYGDQGRNSVAFGIFQGENSTNFPLGSIGTLLADALGITGQDNCDVGPCNGLAIPGALSALNADNYCGIGYHCDYGDIAESCAGDAGLAALGLDVDGLLDTLTLDQLRDKARELATGPGAKALIGSVLGRQGRGVFLKNFGRLVSAYAVYDAVTKGYHSFSNCLAKNAPIPYGK